jgi:NAD(P)-dependent dehydrogenase (short-subunit alcohol dehydrogenase family)
MRLEGKKSIVTGAVSGIGFAIATTFVRKGAKVAILDINDRTHFFEPPSVRVLEVVTCSRSLDSAQR